MQGKGPLRGAALMVRPVEGGLMHSLSPFVPALQAKPAQPGAKQKERGGLGNRLIAGCVLARSCAEGEDHFVDPGIPGDRHVQYERGCLIDKCVVGAIARNRAIGGIVHPANAGRTDDGVRRHCIGSEQVKFQPPVEICEQVPSGAACAVGSDRMLFADLDKVRCAGHKRAGCLAGREREKEAAEILADRGWIRQEVRQGYRQRRSVGCEGRAGVQGFAVGRIDRSRLCLVAGYEVCPAGHGSGSEQGNTESGRAE